MFFHINEEFLRQLREQAEAAKNMAEDAQPEDPGPRIVIGADGLPIIDDPSLVTVISVQDGSPPDEDLERTSVLTPIGWVPIKQHPFWRG